MSDSESWIEGSVLITNETGLHARPAVKLTRLSKTFDSRIEIRLPSNDKWVNAKSPSAVMRLKARPVTMMEIRACGGDADAALEALIDLVAADFGENDSRVETA